ncbi:hypothetical protein MHM93_14305 [Pseudoalteromonas sp. MM17-2]|uniref:hypothetical protein n=1 Tax=Pseudoalteromonas sp. MM17-2 TaxID=2917753 RepID=UPI001EF53A29|nr:hypothetical protein [Pseudoalteromonas sp. MM17-2]MCG7545349.1 hypothetical protein [Pseudoalteromonas sp. MM17-2]
MNHQPAINAINKEIARLTKQRDKLKALCNSNPAQELIDLQLESKKKLDEYKTLGERTSPEFLRWLDGATKRQKAIIKRIGDMTNGKDEKRWEELVRLESEVTSLSHSASLLSLRG